MTYRMHPDPEPQEGFAGMMRRVRQAANWLGTNTLGRALALGTMDPQRPETQEAYRSALGLGADFTPVVGDVKALVHDAPQLFAEGHPVWGTVAAASAVPLLGAPLDAVRKLAPARRAVMEEHFPFEAFHGTFDEIDEIDLSKGDIGFHVGTESQASNRLADVATTRGEYGYLDPEMARNWDRRYAGAEEFSGARVMPLRVNTGKSLRMPDVGAWQDPEAVAYELKQLPQFRYSDIDGIIAAAPDDKAALAGLREEVQRRGYDSIVYKNMAENEAGGSTALTPAAKREWDEILAGREAGEIPTKEAEERLMSIFNKRTSYQSPDSYIMLDPKDIRSRNAAFDPASIGQAGLMRAAVPAAGYFGVQSARERLSDRRDQLRRR